MSEIMFASVYEQDPANWQSLEVIDLDTGESLRDVVECDVRKGVIVRYARDTAGNLVATADGKAPELETKRGRFEIRRKERR